MIIFWILIIVLIVYLIRGEMGSSHKQLGHTGETSMDLLKKRYAKGEITKKEFDEIKKDLV